MNRKRYWGVSDSTAWSVRYKFLQTMRERDDSQPLQDIVAADAYLGSESSGSKHGSPTASIDATSWWISCPPRLMSQPHPAPASCLHLQLPGSQLDLLLESLWRFLECALQVACGAGLG